MRISEVCTVSSPDTGAYMLMLHGGEPGSLSPLGRLTHWYGNSFGVLMLLPKLEISCGGGYTTKSI